MNLSAAEIRRNLLQLNRRGRLAFGAACCERLLPAYSAFHKETAWGDDRCLKTALDDVWQYVQERKAAIDASTHRNRCGSIAPDLDDFESDSASYALYAVSAVCGVLDYLINDDIDRLAQAPCSCIDAIDLYVFDEQCLDPDDPQREWKVLTHPLMQRELKRQHEDLLFLGRAVVRDLKEFAERWREVSRIR